MTWYGFGRWLRSLRAYPARFSGLSHAYRYYRCLLQVPHRWLGKPVHFWHKWYWQTKGRALSIIIRDVKIALKTEWALRRAYWSLRPVGRA